LNFNLGGIVNNPGSPQTRNFHSTSNLENKKIMRMKIRMKTKLEEE